MGEGLGVRALGEVLPKPLISKSLSALFHASPRRSLVPFGKTKRPENFLQKTIRGFGCCPHRN
jgi:hypothetical protein